MFSKQVTSVKGLGAVAKALIEFFPAQRIFAFYGEMGAGKTTFIQAICKILGSDDYVTSPTFAIINEYSTVELNPLFHFDFYRIKNVEEAFDIGYEDYLYSGNYCLIEWPEKIEQILPDNIVAVKIEVIDNETRNIEARII
ncbi:tRNA threonylcarbamoyladenosine biosynthesis protein TsaE [hydrothermal vent metagenome]|uniref:tRNA threonylcarbamoyladenosine biosynthesis protein TsaE n=1 Tax=hydrothermal vent metagenome TaxID=652676 RepID=A0A3B0UVH8_9ZZZZ